ncbi:MAG: AAA family ATPase [archaeon]|nr:AAA family ATPase [archaeon]
MRIKKISIESFGSVKNFWEELKDDMTVVYGPNEAGKSTIAEFIRTTLFPNKSRNVRYPGDDKSDCGYIEIQMDDGDTRTLKRKGRKVVEKDRKKTFDEEMKEFDLQTYSSIYGLDLKELASNKSISVEKVKSKFLRAMGGESAPKICDQIGKKLDSLMNRERMIGNKPIERLLQDRKEIIVRIREIEEGLDKYDQCMEEKRELEEKIRKNKAQLKEGEAARKQCSIAKSHRPNVEHYKSLVEEYEKDVSFSNDLLSKDCDNYESLKEKANAISSELNDYRNIVVCERAEEIEEIWKKRNQYLKHLEKRDRIKDEITHDENDVKEIEADIGWTVDDVARLDIEQVNLMVGRESRRRNGWIYQSLPYFGKYGMLFVLILTGMLLFVPADQMMKISVLIFGMTYMGFGILLNLWNKPSATEWSSYMRFLRLNEDTTPESVNELLEELFGLIKAANKLYSKNEEFLLHEDYIQAYENSVKSFLSIIKASNEKIFDCVKEVHDISVHARKLTADRNAVCSRIDRLFNKYGGEEQFNKKYEVKRNLEKKFLEKEKLRKAIESSAGMPINDVMSLINNQTNEEIEFGEESDRDNRRIGELNKEISSMMNDDEMVDLRVRYNSIETGLEHELYEWAVNSLAKSIMEEAISCLDGDIQPVIRNNADHYLLAMTNGRYKLSSDPVGSELTVEDNFGEKGAVQWSSGLSDQVYLSIKMAIAQGINSEKIPMIMDDVLVKFDANRKKAACDVIYEFSRVNQVILFTCDSSVREYFENKNVNMIDLSTYSL